MNGTISKESITADPEAIKQVSLSGATIVNVEHSILRSNVPFMIQGRREAFKCAVQEANRLELELCVENCADWSSSGGPWNTVTNAMQRITTIELCVSVLTNFSALLPQPPTTLDFHRDIAMLAFPTPAAESIRMEKISPIVSNSSGETVGDPLNHTFYIVTQRSRGRTAAQA